MLLCAQQGAWDCERPSILVFAVSNGAEAKGSPIDEDGRGEVPYISWHHFHVLAFAIAFRYYIFTDDHVVTTRLLQSTRSMYDEIIGNRRVSQKIVWPLQ